MLSLPLPMKETMMKRLIMLLLILPFIQGLLCASDDVFKTLERIRVEVDQPFSSFTTFKPLPDGFILLVTESRTNQNTGFLVKIDKNGLFQKKYKNWGNGPGQLRNIDGIYVLDESILACENSSPWLHQFDLNLNFVKDIKIEKGGKVVVHNDKYIGIWSLNIKGDQEIYKLALYNRSNFKFNRLAYHVKEIPLLVQHWGGICEIDKNTFAGVYPPEFQIKIFDNEFNFKRDIIKNHPGHIAKYSKWKKDPQTLDNEMLDWYYSWAKIHSIFYVKNHFIVKYFYKKKPYLDIIDKEGNFKYKQIGFNNKSLSAVEGDSLWILEWKDTEEDIDYFLNKVVLNI
jgi:hypothetical protein